MKRDHEPTYAPHSTMIGQLHRYNPYERLPRATSAGLPKNDRVARADGCTTAPTTTIDKMDTSVSSHRNSDRSVRWTLMNATMRPAVAANPATFNINPTPLDTPVLARHGRHTNAAPAPSSSPLERVSVDRYMKLIRSDVSAPGEASHHVRTITAAAAQRTHRPICTFRRLPRVSATKASGHSKYHCSSTARLHRCRRGEKFPKYWAPPTIWPQLAK